VISSRMTLRGVASLGHGHSAYQAGAN